MPRLVRRLSVAGAPILITGGGGQLARALDDAARVAGIPATRAGRPEFDFDRPDSLDAVMRDRVPSLVVNAAAYTAVDAAETDEVAAYRANRDGPARLAALAATAGVPIVHVSTDFVFDGSKGSPYSEADPTSPLGVYGASKLAGERAVLSSGARAIVLRTSWVYAPEGKNFVLTMLNAARRTDRLRVVADQRGCPTMASDLAEGIIAIVGAAAADGLAERIWRHRPRRRKRLDHLARVCRGNLRERGKARRGAPLCGADRHRRLAHPGTPPGEFAAGLHQAGRDVRRASASLARQPVPRDRRNPGRQGLD